MPDDLQAIGTVVAGLIDMRDRHSAPRAEPHASVTADNIVRTLQEFMECVRYLNTRRRSGAILRLADEADVQDAIYLMLRPWIHDLVPEDPSGKVGNRHTIKDFVSHSAKTVIEAKFVRDRTHGKQITKELHDDIETYRHHPACDDLVFFIYDPDSLIPDKAALERALHATRVYNGRSLRVTVVIKP